MSLFGFLRSRTHDADLTAWNQLVESNSRWWAAVGSVSADNPFSFYDRDAVIEENHHSEVIVRLNEHIITEDSQCGRCKARATKPHPDCIRFCEDRDGLRSGSLAGCACTELQRPYFPTNIWAVPTPWRENITGVDPAALRGVVKVAFIGSEYLNDGDSLLRKVFNSFERASHE